MHFQVPSQWALPSNCVHPFILPALPLLCHLIVSTHAYLPVGFPLFLPVSVLFRCKPVSSWDASEQTNVLTYALPVKIDLPELGEVWDGASVRADMMWSFVSHWRLALTAASSGCIMKWPRSVNYLSLIPVTSVVWNLTTLTPHLSGPPPTSAAWVPPCVIVGLCYFCLCGLSNRTAKSDFDMFIRIPRHAFCLFSTTSWFSRYAFPNRPGTMSSSTLSTGAPSLVIIFLTTQRLSSSNTIAALPATHAIALYCKQFIWQNSALVCFCASCVLRIATGRVFPAHKLPFVAASQLCFLFLLHSST